MRIKTTDFHYHRAGWKTATHVLQCFDWPVTVYDWLEYQIKIGTPMESDWIGFLHSPLHKPQGEYTRYDTAVPSVKEIVSNPVFLDRLKTCRGIYTLARHTAEFLKRHINVPVENLVHPVEAVSVNFNYDSWKKNKRVVTVGQWMRRLHSICDINPGYQKCMLSLKRFGINDYQEMSKFTNNIDTVKLLEYQNNDDYDQLLGNTVVFLDLYDAAACNTLLECLIRNTPICVNLMPCTVEYLGTGYPLYYESISEASAKLASESKVQEAHEYMKAMDKKRFSPAAFAKSIADSYIYRMS